MHGCEVKLVNKTGEHNFVLPNGKSVSLTQEGIELFNSNLNGKQIYALTEQAIRQLD
jgi:hypothetical protein